jgi:hypothetical protein
MAGTPRVHNMDVPSDPTRRCSRLAAVLLAVSAPLVLPVGAALAAGCSPTGSASPVPSSASPAPTSTPRARPTTLPAPTATAVPSTVPTSSPTPTPCASSSASPTATASARAGTRPVPRQGTAGSSRVPLLFAPYQPSATSSRADSFAPPLAPLPSGTFQPALPYREPAAAEPQALREYGARTPTTRPAAIASALLLLLVAAHLRQLSRRRPD